MLNKGDIKKKCKEKEYTNLFKIDNEKIKALFFMFVSDFGLQKKSC